MRSMDEDMARARTSVHDLLSEASANLRNKTNKTEKKTSQFPCCGTCVALFRILNYYKS